MRAVGLNAVLAQCGAPVRAQRLCLSPLAVGSSICVLDSLQGGISRFYAEIRRLKQIVDLTQGPFQQWRTAEGRIARPTAVGLLFQDDSSLFRTRQLAFQVVEHRLNPLDFLEQYPVSRLRLRHRVLPCKQLAFERNTGKPLS